MKFGKQNRSVVGQLAVLALILIALMAGLFSYVFEDFTWGVIAGLVILSITTDFYTEGVPGYFARIMLNPLTHEQRVLFQGLHFVLPWESVTSDVDLRTDLHQVLTETYPSLDAQMEGRYVYTVKPVATEADVLLYKSFEADAVVMQVRAIFSMLLSDHFSRKAGKDLLDKEAINQKVFREEPGKSLIEDFEKAHGVKVTVRLEDVDFNKNTQDERDVLSRAESYAAAVQHLVDAKMDPAEAAKTVRRLSNLTGVEEHIIDVSGIPNVRDISILGGMKGGKKP